VKKRETEVKEVKEEEGRERYWYRRKEKGNVISNSEQLSVESHKRILEETAETLKNFTKSKNEK
jgi:hypothetical protein